VAAAALLALALPGRALELSTPPSDVVIKLDERGIRAAGIATTAIARERGTTDLSLPGTIAIPQQQIRIIAAPAGGLVEAMLIAADEPAEAGQAIARLRSPDVVEAQRQFLGALADEALAADRLRRSQLLFDGHALPERDLRVAQTESTVAKSRLDERTQILSLMEMTDAEIETLRATRKIFSTLTVYSPIAGTVVTRHASAGEQIRAAAPLFTVAELNPLWVNIQVPATLLANITTGSLVSLPAHDAHGRVIRIGRSVDPTTQSAIVVAEISTDGGKVRPGLAVNVSLRLEQQDHAQQNGHFLWSVPAAAVVRHRDRAWVFLRSTEGFRARPVQVVAESARLFSIRADLTEGDQVASRGVLALLSSLADVDKD
jgi:RND family efflux transporter MFP subunit